MAENTNQSTAPSIPTVKSALTYEVPEIAEMLKISKRTAYDFCKKTKEFKVVNVGRCVRIHKESFDNWFAGCRG